MCPEELDELFDDEPEGLLDEPLEDPPVEGAIPHPTHPSVSPIAPAVAINLLIENFFISFPP